MAVLLCGGGAHGIPRDKIFSEKISTRIRVRPQFEAALALAREIKAHVPHCRVLALEQRKGMMVYAGHSAGDFIRGMRQ